MMARRDKGIHLSIGIDIGLPAFMGSQPASPFNQLTGRYLRF